MITPKTVLTDNLNGTLITYNGNEFMLQNDMGNAEAGQLSEGFYPIGMKEFGGIMYIVSVNSNKELISSTITATPNSDVAIETVAYAIRSSVDSTFPDFSTSDAFSIIDGDGYICKDANKTEFIVNRLNGLIGVLLTKVNVTPNYKMFEIGSFPSLNPEHHTTDEEWTGDFEYVYRPLHNLITTEKSIAEFRTNKLPGYDTQHPVTIEVQKSYDGSVNLILTDDKNPPRLINSGFAVLGDGKGKFVKRNQDAKTNYYEEEYLDLRTRLINISTKFTYIDLGDGYDGEIDGVQFGGELKGGNYTFYLKYGDDDGNQTDIICESGIVSVFKGTPGDPFSMSGAFANEKTDKAIFLTVRNVDTNYSKIYLYYTREYCDLNGYRLTEAKALTAPYPISSTNTTILISGVELAEDISIEELNIAYYTIGSSKAIAQQQNILFLGNIHTNTEDIDKLQTLSYSVRVGIDRAKDVGYVNPNNYTPTNKFSYKITGYSTQFFRYEEEQDWWYETWTDYFTEVQRLVLDEYYIGYNEVVSVFQDGFITENWDLANILLNVLKSEALTYRDLLIENLTNTEITSNERITPEYYSTKNIYYSVGYWPNELYRFGIVYIKSDGSKTDVFDLYGCELTDNGDTNLSLNHNLDLTQVDADGIFVSGGSYKENLKGVFKLPNDDSLYGIDNLVYPFGISFNISNALQAQLSELGIIGYMIVRQKRIPITICQGFSVGINSDSYIPMLYSSDEGYFTESFITNTIDTDSSDDFDVYDRLLVNSNYYSTNGIYQKRYMAYVEFRQNIQSMRKTKKAIGIFGYKEHRNIYIDDPHIVSSNNLIYTSDSENNIEYSKGFNTEPGEWGKNLPMFDYCYELIVYKEGKTQETRERVEQVISTLKDSPNWTNMDDNPKYGNSTINIDLSPDELQPLDNNMYRLKPVALDKVNKYKLSTRYYLYESLSKLDNNKTKELPIRGDAIVFNYEGSNIINVNRVAYHIYKGLNNKDSTRFRYQNQVNNNSFGLLSIETRVTPDMQSIFDGSEFILNKQYTCNLVKSNNERMFYTNLPDALVPSSDSIFANVVYIPEDTQLKYINGVGFSTKVGNGTEQKSFGFLKERPFGNTGGDSATRDDLVRGLYSDFIGVFNIDNFIPSTIYSILIKHDSTYKLDFLSRAINHSEYYAITNNTPITNNVIAYRGDCYTNTVTIRMHRNFIDATAPIADVIVDSFSWQKNYKGLFNKETEWDNINISDLNTVDLGHWVTFKCLASSNLALRSLDTTNVTEMALMGNPRGFYPVTGASTATAMKVADTNLFNDGYNATASRVRQQHVQDVPYNKNEFNTRIMFSNVAVTDAFINGYRTFQGASYQDYPATYGQIIKLLPWGSNLFCVFEHGIAIIPVNEKALMQTQTDETIHIYGHGVLPEQMTIVSQDFGSLWADSVIRTPLGIYGVDTVAKKIWQFTDSKGLVTISDMKLQRFLNDNIDLGLISQEDLGIVNVKTHYNNYKGDVMFTFYNGENETTRKQWNLCYNERQGLWITRYDWYPLLSENVDNAFYSIPVSKPFPDDKPIKIWIHGRAGSQKDIIKNNDAIRPTKWYGDQKEFSFQFVAGEPLGQHKIFEDLIITSNNVQPQNFEFEIIGDSYLFNRARIWHDNVENDAQGNIYFGKGNMRMETPYEWDDDFVKDNYANNDFTPLSDNTFKKYFYNAKVTYDDVLDEYTLVIKQDCKNKESYGVRLGNIQYKEDGWYANIEPLRYNKNLNDPSVDPSELSEEDPFASAKIRDKWLKVRVTYKGDRLAIIGAVTTSENISYA